MIRLSVNVNKAATLRNSRGGTEPRVLDAVAAALAGGAGGITVHPRADRRHITPEDVRDIARALEGRRPAVEYNIEGDPRLDLLELVQEVRADQCTLVPVVPGEITSQAGWSRSRAEAVLAALVARGVARDAIHLTAAGTTDPLTAADSAGQARINRSVSFVVSLGWDGTGREPTR